ncbi:type II toxin-antitoxin system death-on-curing family toxin [Paenibacillus koleovorans]|uniref:type II toxin-antitoxin system death-on-curing family toxin n=1 Tax=Paenibacillus koleovorans TaxID=121608 RepID=UPI000FD710F7|nr:type II toxin-antitoxin system death-on-curing family toxin [Paenibacillus koleovorans]
MIYLTVEEIIFFNTMLIEEHGGKEMIGVKDIGLLDSAVNRPKMTAFGKELYDDPFKKAGALLESLAKNHCFQNANKRTSLLAMTTFLALNGYMFEMGQKEIEDFIVDIVVGKYSLEQVIMIIEEHSHQMSEND